MREHDKVLEIIRLKDQAPLDVDSRKAALIVIDVQRYFVSPEYAFARVLEKLYMEIGRASCRERV